MSSAATSSPQWTGRVLDGWNPEEESAWSSSIAWRTLAIMTFSLMLNVFKDRDDIVPFFVMITFPLLFMLLGFKYLPNFIGLYENTYLLILFFIAIFSQIGFAVINLIDCLI